METSVLKNTALESPLGSVSVLRPTNKKARRNVLADLMLTSLIDALAILVIYLLINFSNTGEILYISKDMVLPEAVNSEQLDRTLVVKVENGEYFIEDKTVRPEQLTERLLELNKKSIGQQKTELNEKVLTVQADKKTTYDVLSQIVHAGSQAGYGEIKFAVIAK